MLVGLSVLAWRGGRAEVAASLERELISVATIAAASFNPQQTRFLVPGEEKSRTYRRLRARLRAIQQATGSVRAVLVDAEERVRADGDGRIDIFGPAPRLALDRVEFNSTLQTGRAQVSVPFTGTNGERYLAVYAPVPEPEVSDELFDLGTGPRIVLALEAPAAALDATDRIASYLFGICLFAIVLVAGITLLVASSITRPLLRLTDEAEVLAEGQLDAPISTPARDDEVAHLARTLEGMRTALQGRDQERQMMLAGIAHEVRNPLGGMELFSGLLAEAIDELDDEQPPSDEERAELASHAERVQKELRYLTGVVNDFLAFARELPAERKLVDVRALCEDVAALRSDAGPVEVKADSFEFGLDRGRIKESLLNLVANAQQASPTGATVTLEAKLDDGWLALTVEDRGKGMDEATVDRAFAPFFTTREKGSGLGLPLVRKFARDHGGDAEIRSTLGQGTRITLRLAKGVALARASDDEEPILLGDDEPGLLGDE